LVCNDIATSQPASSGCPAGPLPGLCLDDRHWLRPAEFDRAPCIANPRAQGRL